MANILQFNGGKFLRADPSIIGTQFATRLFNVDIDSVILKSLKGPIDKGTEVSDSFYYFEGWQSAPDSDYIEYGNRLYYSRPEETGPEKFNGIDTFNLGIAKPEGTIVLTDSDFNANSDIVERIAKEEEPTAPEEAIVQYTVTYCNPDDGTESAPMTFTEEHTAEAGKVVELTNIPVSDDPQVTEKNIYRLGGELVTMSLVAQIPNAITEHRDTRRGKASDIGVSEVLDSIDNIPPDPRLTSLVEAYGIFFGMVGNELRFSEIDNPNYWPPQNSFRLRRNGTGLLVTLQGLLVFTDTDTYLLSGTNSQTFTLTLLSDKQGCISHKSCQLIKNLPLWISYEGVCTLENFSVNVLSKFFLDTREILVKQTEVFDEQYYIVLTDGTINVLELKDTARFYDIRLDRPITGIRRYRDKLYFAIGGTLHEAFAGEQLRLEYTSPILTDDNHSIMKSYNKIYIRYNGSFTIKMYIDEILAQTATVNSDTDCTLDLQPPSTRQRGYSCRFEIEGVGKIYSIETLPIPRPETAGE